MDFTDFLFPDNMEKYKFPVYFNYRKMICTFINLNESMGTMLFTVSYDPSVREEDRDIYDALELIQKDDLFDYLIALHYDRAVLEKHAFIDMREDGLSRIYVSLTTAPAFEYIHSYAEASKFNLLSKGSVIYSVEKPFGLKVQIDGISYSRRYIVKISVLKSEQYEPYAKMVLPFFVHMSVIDVTDTEDSDSDVEKSYRVRNHIGLFSYLASTELRDAFTAIQEYISPSETWAFAFRKYFAVKGQRRSLNCYILTRAVGTKSFYIDDISFYNMSLRVPVTTRAPENLNVTMMQSVGTYALSCRGTITIPHITYTNLSDHNGYRDANAQFVPEHIVLDPSLPSPLDVLPAQAVNNELLVETIPVTFKPNVTYFYFPVTPSFFMSDIVAYVKISASSGEALEDIIYKFTNDHYALTMLSEDDSWVYFAIRDRSFKDRYLAYVCPTWDYDSMSKNGKRPTCDKAPDIVIHDSLENLLFRAVGDFSDEDNIVGAWNESHYLNPTIQKIKKSRMQILQEKVEPENSEEIPSNKVNDTSFLGRLKKKLFG